MKAFLSLLSPVVLLLLNAAFCAAEQPDPVPVAAQSQNDPDVGDDGDVHAIFRLSTDYLNSVIQSQKISTDIPLCANVLGFRCTGTIHGEGKANVRLETESDERDRSATFTIESQGSGYARVKGQRGPLLAYGPAWGPFSSSTQVRFDGRNFRHLETIPSVRLCVKVDRLTGHHDRKVGQILGAGMQPLAERLLPKARAQATPIANCYLKKYIEKLADQIIAKLNETSPVEASLNRLFPETNDWSFQVTSSERYLQAAYGIADASPVALPELSQTLEVVLVEAWLLSTGEEARLLEQLNQSPLAKTLVQRYLRSSLPELESIADDHSISAVGNWVVIRIGRKNETDEARKQPDPAS